MQVAHAQAHAQDALRNDAGKTFTMDGVDDPAQPALRGITLNAFDSIFDHIADDRIGDPEYLVYITFLEIYNEDVRDLLSKNGAAKLQLKEAPDQGVYVKDLKKARRWRRMGRLRPAQRNGGRATRTSRPAHRNLPALPPRVWPRAARRWS